MLFWQVRGGQDKKGHDDASRIPPYQYEDRKTAALISQSRRVMGRDNALLYDGFFSFAVVRQFFSLALQRTRRSWSVPLCLTVCVR